MTETRKLAQEILDKVGTQLFGKTGDELLEELKKKKAQTEREIFIKKVKKTLSSDTAKGIYIGTVIGILLKKHDIV